MFNRRKTKLHRIFHEAVTFDVANLRFSESWVKDAWLAPGKALTTTWDPAGKLLMSGVIACLNWRVTLCRTTEFPTFLPTAKATFVFSLEV